MGVAVEHELPKSDEAPALARDAVRSLHPAVAEPVVEDAALLVSELVTNAVKYGGEGQLRLEMQGDQTHLRAEIVDQGSGFEPEVRDMPLAAEGGWGLHLVESLADEWGVHEGSTHVWFELRR